jgi:threonine dehydrogenase-like Zn-dependent dehydrogenase
MLQMSASVDHLQCHVEDAWTASYSEDDEPQSKETVMRATIMYGARDVRVEQVPDPSIVEQTDAIIRVVRACICGSDLWPYNDMPKSQTGQSMGHEAIGVVEAVGKDVRRVKPGQVVVMPFAFSDGTCEFCRENLPTACVHVGFIGNAGMNGAQSEALRIPYADGTLYPLDVSEDDALMPSLLTLSDVMGTGHHAAVVARVAPGQRVAVVGDGAVGLCGVIAAKRLGAEQIIMMGRHQDRIVLAREFGATDVVSERGPAAVERVRELTGGHGAHSVLECVGTADATLTAIEIARPGGAVGRVGVPHYPAIPGADLTFFKNVTVGGGPAPVRAYINELLPDIREGRIQPGRVFDRTVGLDGVPDGYRAMNERATIKVMIAP